MIPDQATITTPSRQDRFANAVEMFTVSLIFFAIGLFLFLGVVILLSRLILQFPYDPDNLTKSIAFYLGGIGCWLKAYVWHPWPYHQQRRLRQKLLAAQNLEELDQLDIVNTVGSLLILFLLGYVFLLSPYVNFISVTLNVLMLLLGSVPRIQRLYRAIQTQRQLTSKLQ